MNLDAVFFPKCVEDIQIFRQEGWHFELNDPFGDISYKGCTSDWCSQFSCVLVFNYISFGKVPCFWLINSINFHVWKCVNFFVNNFFFLLIIGAVFNQMKKYYSQPAPISILKQTTRQASFLSTSILSNCLLSMFLTFWQVYIRTQLFLSQFMSLGNLKSYTVIIYHWWLESYQFGYYVSLVSSSLFSLFISIYV